MNLRLIKGRTEDLGPLVRLPCPQCEDVQWFHLKQHSTNVGILGIKVSGSITYSVDCSGCEYTIDLSKEDAEKAIAFLPISRSFSNKKIPESEFLSRLTDAELTFVKQFARANTYWNCPNCGEESPLTFRECWNCGHRNDNSYSEPEADRIRTPYLDNLVDNDNNPFGTMRL